MDSQFSMLSAPKIRFILATYDEYDMKDRRKDILRRSYYLYINKDERGAS